MALDRLRDRDYRVHRDPYRLTLTDRAQYLVRLVSGSEVLARWDTKDGDFRRIAGSTAGPRNTLIVSAQVAAVATARCPGSPGARTRWCPFDQCRHDTAAPQQTVAQAILAIITAHGPQTTAQLCARLPHLPPDTVRTTIPRLAGRSQIGRSTGTVGTRVRIAWTVGGVAYDVRKRVGRPLDADAWTPGVWIHDIRRRALGLPVVTRRRDEMDADFGHPMKGAA